MERQIDIDIDRYICIMGELFRFSHLVYEEVLPVALPTPVARPIHKWINRYRYRKVNIDMDTDTDIDIDINIDREMDRLIDIDIDI